LNVTLEAIKFNHQANSATNDGFSIRHNEIRPLRSPEWEIGISSNSEDSPAAYALDQIENQTLSIQAKISCTDIGGDKLWIRTVDGNIHPERPDIGGFLRFVFSLIRPVIRRAVVANVLGVVKAKEITQTDDFQTFCLEDVRLQEAGIGVYEVIWRWQFSTDGYHWTDFQETKHRIYSTLNLPKGKWRPNSDNPANTQLPWTEVLKIACQWAAGAKCEREIADKITSAVNNLGPTLIHYDEDTVGSPHYTKEADGHPPRFDCQRFVDLLNGQSQDDKDQNVNCSDCAAIVTALVSLLGYELPEMSVSSPVSDEIPLRRHRRIGLQQWEPAGETFNFHAIAWKGQNADEVSDACVLLDINENIAGEPIPFLPTNFRFGQKGEHFYRHFLVPEGKDDNCKPSSEPMFRRIGLTLDDNEVFTSQNNLERIKRLYDYDLWLKPAPGQPHLELYGRLHSIEDFGGWTVTSLRTIPRNWIEVFLGKAKQQKKGPRVRIDAQVGTSTKDAEQNLLGMLSGFERPGVKYFKDAGFGDRVFANDSGSVILFSRSNITVLMRNVEREFIALWQLAATLDALIIS
jgi:hypothetical protein